MHAFDVDTGEPAWDQPLAVTTAPDSKGDARRIDLAALQGALVVHADGLYLVEADSGERLGRWEGYDPEHNQYLGATDDSVILYRDTPGKTVVRLTPNP